MSQDSWQREEAELRPPDFLLIGAQKAGTSWLSAMLRQHPDVYIPPTKELHFFNLRENYSRGIDWYLDHFSDHGTATCLGECTPNYLWVGDVPDYVERSRMDQGRPAIHFVEYPNLRLDTHELVHRSFPHAKLLVSLRDPVDRAISSYYHAILKRRVSPRNSILEAGGSEGILAMGFYHAQLSAWMNLFPRDQFQILIYEEAVVHHKRRTLRSIFRYLGVDETFTPQDIERTVNVRRAQLFMRAHYYSPLLTRVAFRAIPALKRAQPPAIPISHKDRAELKQLYEEEIRRLEGLLDRSLDVWRK